MFPLQIWKQPHWIKCSDQFRVNKWDTDCFERLHEENTKLSVIVTVSHAWIFLSTSDFLWFLQKRGEEWRTSNRMGQGCWCSCAIKLRHSEVAIQGWYEKKLTWGMKLKVFAIELRNFWYIIYFILELLSKLNYFAYNLLDVSIQSVISK